MTKAKRYIWVFMMLLGCQCMVSAAVWSVSPWTDDTSTGIDSSYTYTHAVNISSDLAPVINGVQFVAQTGSGANWSYTGNPAHYWGGADDYNVTGAGVDLAKNFHYNGTQLQLTGLTPDALYEITLFSTAWESDPTVTRNAIFTHGPSTFLFPQNLYGFNNGIKGVGIYRADAAGQFTLKLGGDDGSLKLHLYAFANREYAGELPIMIYPASPANFDGGTMVGIDTVLTWEEGVPGSLAVPMFDVYIDPNETKVTNLDPSTRVSTGQTEYSFDPALDWETMYYWRVVTYINGEPNLATDIRSFKTIWEEEHWSDSAWTNDADSGISVGKVYSHKVNFRESEGVATTVNGVPFENDNNRTGQNWELTGTPNAHGDTNYAVTGDSGLLIKNFFYGAPQTLSLNGLTPGQDYVLTLYTRGWGDPGGRVINITTSADGRTKALDENIGGNNNGHLFKYAYTAPTSGELTVTFAAQTADTWHHYAFSNEIAVPVYVDPSPMPGSNVDADVVLNWTLNGETVNPTYTLKVATNPAMSSPIVSLDNLMAPSYDPVLNSDMTYYWQVQVVEAGNVIYTSPVWHFQTTPPPDAIKVIEWKLDETTGTIANQTGPSDDADGILKNFDDPNTAGVSHVAGLVNNGLLLNGTDEYVDVSNASIYMPTAAGQNFSVSCYFRTFGSYGPLFSMRHSVEDNPLIDLTIGADGAQDNAGTICMIVRDDLYAYATANSGIKVNDGRWHNLAVTRAGGNWTMYIDGIKRASINGAATGQVTLDWLALGTSLRWLNTNWNPTMSHYRYFKGILDEYTIWDGELSPKQIKQLAAIVPPQGDIDADLDTDMDDLNALTDAWLDDYYVAVQPSPVVLENMDAYTNDPNTYQDYLAYTEEKGTFGLLTLSFETDSMYSQVLRVDYDFDGHLHAHIPVRLIEKRINSSLYDTFITRIKKPAGCDISKLIIDFYDGRGYADPITDNLLHTKGRITIDITGVAMDEWVAVEAPIPSGVTFDTCTDLYQIMYSIEDGGADTGTLYIGSIELADSTTDCVPSFEILAQDLTGDCFVNLLDFEKLAENWMTGL
ncbi:MAG: LamG domain-containing protein [Sedimentisphaerales bacterium]|nr:LamG domain-containing protein [Sedimentisphaerales bacterium]